jgi:hypothetical protein
LSVHPYETAVLKKPLDCFDQNQLYLLPGLLPRNKPKMALNFERIHEMIPPVKTATNGHQKGTAYEDSG